MTVKIEMPTDNSMLAEIMFVAITKVENSEEAQVALQKFDLLLGNAAASLGESEVRAIERQMSDVFVTIAQGAFMWGWSLRDNPNLLASMLQAD